MKISIAIDSYRLIYEPNTSISKYIEELVTSFMENPLVIKIYLLLPMIPDWDFQYRFLCESDKVEFVCSLKRYKANKNWWTNVMWQQWGALQNLKDLEVNYFISTYHQVPLLLPKTIKSIAVIHDLCGLNTSLYPLYKKGFYKHLFNFVTALLRADVFIPISEFTRSRFQNKFPFTEKRINDVVYNTISTDEITHEDMIMSLHHFNLKPLSYFFVIGNMSSRKGIDLIVEAFKIYRNRGGDKTLLLVVGACQVNDIKVLFERQNIDNIIITTCIKEKEKDSLYKGALALLFPSRCEGFGYPVLEAMVQGCPIIAWAKSPAFEIMGGSEHLLADLTPQEIVKYLDKYEHLSRFQRELFSTQLNKRAKIFLAQDFGDKFFETMVGNDLSTNVKVFSNN